MARDGIDRRTRKDGTVAYRARKRIPGQDRPAVKTFNTLEEAEQWRLDVTQSVRRGRWGSGASMSVVECIEQYIDRKASSWQGNTMSIHERNLRLRIEGHRIGRIRIADLTPSDVQTWIDSMEGKPATVKLAGQTLSGALAHAARMQLIPANPAANVIYPGRVEFKVNPWTRAEVHQVYATVRNDARLNAFYRLALGTGARSGELRALHWDDISNGVVYIHRTVHGSGTALRIREGTKSGPGRKVTVPASVMEALASWRAVSTGPLVFPAPQATGIASSTGILDASTLLRWHKETCGSAGVRWIRIHDIRHTAATLMLAAGVEVKIVSVRLGHKTTQMTQDVYQHVDTAMQEVAVSRLESWLNG